MIFHSYVSLPEGIVDQLLEYHTIPYPCIWRSAWAKLGPTSRSMLRPTCWKVSRLEDCAGGQADLGWFNDGVMLKSPTFVVPNVPLTALTALTYTSIGYPKIKWFYHHATLEQLNFEIIPSVRQVHIHSSCMPKTCHNFFLGAAMASSCTSSGKGVCQQRPGPVERPVEWDWLW